MHSAPPRLRLASRKPTVPVGASSLALTSTRVPVARADNCNRTGFECLYWSNTRYCNSYLPQQFAECNGGSDCRWLVVVRNPLGECQRLPDASLLIRSRCGCTAPCWAATRAIVHHNTITHQCQPPEMPCFPHCIAIATSSSKLSPVSYPWRYSCPPRLCPQYFHFYTTHFLTQHNA